MIYWPECFKTGKINYSNDIPGKLKACADVLCAWGNYYLNNKSDNFGEVMIDISKFLNSSILPEDISELHKKLIKLYKKFPYHADKWYLVKNLNGEVVKAQYKYSSKTNYHLFSICGGGFLRATDINPSEVKPFDE